MDSFRKYLLLKDQGLDTTEGHISRTTTFLQWLKDENLPTGQASVSIEQMRYADVLHYIKYRTAKGNSKRTLQILVNTLKHYFNHLVEEETIKVNPAENILIKGVKRRIIYDILEIEELEEIHRTYQNKGLAAKRNKIIVGLMIYQGVNTSELGKLEVHDVKLREGKIYIPGSRRSNSRELKLEAHQVIDIMEYIAETRKLILAVAGKQSEKLFISIGTGERFTNMATKLLQSLRKQSPKIKDFRQIRASVIVNWLKYHNLRKVQHLAGHRYISSTEKYKANDLEDLQEELNKYHPIS